MDTPFRWSLDDLPTIHCRDDRELDAYLVLLRAAMAHGHALCDAVAAFEAWRRGT